MTFEPGKLLYMLMGEPNSVKGIEGDSLLLTFFLAKPVSRSLFRMILRRVAGQR
jgi:hypothetical protein